MKKTTLKHKKTQLILLTLLVSFAFGLTLGSTSAVNDINVVCTGKNQGDCNAASPDCTWTGSICVTSGPDCGTKTQQECPQVQGCMWNGTACIQEGGGGTDCSQYSSESTCKAVADCWWDDHGGQGNCFFAGGGPQCFRHDDNETACNATQGCEYINKIINATFNDTFCGPAGMGYCSQFDANETGCRNDPKCRWDDHNGQSFCGVDFGGGINPECQTNCSKCQDPGQCGGSAKGCFWNFSQGANRCEQGSSDYNPCAGMPNPQCDNTLGCRYDPNFNNSGSGECVKDDNMNMTGCPSYPTNASCSADTNCEWILDARDNTWRCMRAGGSDCASYTPALDIPGCEANPNCMWDYGRGTCNPGFGGGVCENTFDPETCKRTAGCKWDPNQWRCNEGSVVNCSAQNTSALCTLYGECEWNGTNCNLGACATNCTACNVSDSCMKSPRECWWDFGFEECREHMQPTCENGMCDMCDTAANCVYCNEEENCSAVTVEATCDSYQYCQWNSTDCISSCVDGQNQDNMYCAWFANASQAPGAWRDSASAIAQGDTHQTSNCRMNTTCTQDCFMCVNETECLASNNTAFGGAQGNDTACGWDPFGWSPCYVKGMGGGPGGGGPCDGNCTLCGDEWNCEQSPMGCGWNPSNSPPCSQSNCFSQGCSNCFNQDNCMKADDKYRREGAAGCLYWDYGNGTQVCKDRDCETDCTLCLTETGCNSSGTGCEWTAGGAAASIGLLQTTGTCDFKLGSAGACHAKCEACQTDGDCWHSFTGCQWQYGTGAIVNVAVVNNTFNVTSVSLYPSDSIWFVNTDQANHTVESDPGAFSLPLQSGEGYTRDFYEVINFTVYLADLNCSAVDCVNMTIYVVARPKNESLCTPNSCGTDCSQCSDPPSCDKSFAGCWWDMGMGQCMGKGWGMTCEDDCWHCDSEMKCDASNASMWTPMGEMNGCQWVFDFMDGREACRPMGMTFDCNAMCEQCNETECATAQPTMLPPEASGCKWFANEWTPAGTQGACHPDGFGGMGHGCAQWDFTSKGECESQAGCKWFSVDRICDPDMSAMTCNERCDLCNQTACDEKSPKCVWDTPPFGNPFCREDWGGGGFKFGGNCNDNCFDCFDNQSCINSPMDCRYVVDSYSPNGFRCDPADMPICEEDCFACWNQADCGTSTNGRMYNKTVEECAGEENESECDGNSFCNWTGSACVSVVAQTCEWDSQNHFCKPTGFAAEICFMPGDEDNDGKADCKDEECSFDPMCMFGPTGGGPMGMDIDCWLWDEMQGGNISVCECNESTRTENGTCTDGVSEVNGTGCVWHMVQGPQGPEGLCDPKFNDQVFFGMDEAPPFFILHDPCFDNEQPWINSELGVLQNKSWLDICDIGIKDMDNTTAFILNLKSVRNLSLCNFLSSDSTNESGKYFFLLDTDDNVSSGCTVEVNISEMDKTPSNFMVNESGFEYRLDYTVNHSNGTTIETRTVYKCINGSWGVASAQVSGKKDKACEHESIYYGIRKADIGNPTGIIHIAAFTAELTGGFGSPLVAMDRAQHAYYTPNTIDTNPPDCATDPSACGSGYDPNLGVMLFEDCLPGTGDEDKDGKINCDDDECFTSVFCAGNSTYNASTDRTAPSITSRSVQVEQTLAVLLWTTSEPATGVVQFYGTNSTCEASVQNVSQYNDPFFTMDDYTPAHMVPLDANYPDAAYALTTPLLPNTTYFYKLRSCDQAAVYNNATNTTNPNCAVTKCLNFTTKRPCESITNQTVCLQTGICAWNASLTPKCFKQIEFGFEFTTNSSDPTDYLGGAGFEMDLGGNTTNITAGTKVKTNVTGCDMTLRFKNEMTMLYGQRAPWILEMKKCCVPKQTINLTDALQVSNRTNSSLFLGLNSGIWQQISQKLGCKQVFMHLPGFFQDCGTISVMHCDENGANCVNVSLDNATMTFCNSTVSIWELAGSDTSLFSSYTQESGIDSSAPRLTGYDEPSTIRGDYAVITVTSNENSNVTVHYAPCNMTLFNDNGDCITSILHALVKSTDYANWSNIVPNGQTSYNTTIGKAHEVVLGNLTPETKYFYMVLAMDASMNQRVLNDMDYYYRFTSTTSSINSVSSLVVGWNLISLPLASA